MEQRNAVPGQVSNPNEVQRVLLPRQGIHYWKDIEVNMATTQQSLDVANLGGKTKDELLDTE